MRASAVANAYPCRDNSKTFPLDSASSSRIPILRLMKRAIVSSGPSNQFRYACVPLSLVNVMGGRSSTMTTFGTRCLTAMWYAAAAPAIPAPHTTISAVSITLLGAFGEKSSPDHDDAALTVARVELDRNQATRVHLDCLDQLRTHVHVGGARVVNGQPVDEKSGWALLDIGLRGHGCT